MQCVVRALAFFQSVRWELLVVCLCCLIMSVSILKYFLCGRIGLVCLHVYHVHCTLHCLIDLHLSYIQCSASISNGKTYIIGTDGSFAPTHMNAFIFKYLIQDKKTIFCYFTLISLLLMLQQHCLLHFFVFFASFTTIQILTLLMQHKSSFPWFKA